MSSVVVDIIRELLFRNRDRKANPVLDGPMRPNSALDECPVASSAVREPDDIAFAADGSAYVTSGNRVIRFADGAFDKPVAAAEFHGLATGIAALPAGGMIVGVAGVGLAFVDGTESGRMIEIHGQGGLKCPTALAVGPDGSIFVCDGSQHNTPIAGSTI